MYNRPNSFYVLMVSCTKQFFSTQLPTNCQGSKHLSKLWRSRLMSDFHSHLAGCLNLSHILILVATNQYGIISKKFVYSSNIDWRFIIHPAHCFTLRSKFLRGWNLYLPRRFGGQSPLSADTPRYPSRLQTKRYGAGLPQSQVKPEIIKKPQPLYQRIY